ncbi:CD225/dispanin family protein [Neptunitalea lumnitzerae]|uniref:Interferon-induced transmembrane protein n=1 Tax=Neptunitalea lumnitzerae TaxID=2965509 RepID=A0ABQ5MHP1_9FLAO|nr:CD225/dispanin family protein [Neptunitalea sp. Y10]GLB48931.1 hypothetical protein Y10_12990 [Neptunitalea sp. Y10]
METPMKPKNYLVESILVTIFCCLIFGIIGIVNASKVNSEYAAGNFAAAEEASRNAKKWTMWGLIVGLVGTILYIILMVAGVAGGAY